MDQMFNPPFFLKSTFVQTILAGRKPNRWKENSILNATQEMIINPLKDVRLQGFYSRQMNGRSKGVVMLLHGWEGSSNSAYILNTGRFLYHNGFSVFRLNYRDHGDSHHLNPGLFYAVLLDEVFQAVRLVSGFEKELPFYLAGFSMGGNFALRIGRKCAEIPIENLSYLISISPVLDPEKSTYAIDKVRLIRTYFRKKWLRSLIKKQECFPDRYDFNDVLEMESITEMTDYMIERYSDYKSAVDYFKDYTLLGNALTDIPIPTTIIAAKDDPIIPFEDFLDLRLNSLTNLILHNYGGHNGFVEDVFGRRWYEQEMLRVFK